KSTEKNLTELGIDLFHQSPVFQNENQVLVEGKLVSADTFVIATGMIPRELKINGNELLKVSDDILNLKKLPESATFIGSGYVGMEFACMMAMMGTKVTIIEQSEEALNQFDNYLVEKLVSSLENIGITF